MARHHSREVSYAPDGQRLCSRGPWCSARTRDPETGEWHPAPAAQPLCVADEQVMLRCLAELPAMYARLGTLSVAPVRTGRAVRVPPGSRVLPNVEADAQMRLTADLLGGWAARVRTVPQLSLARHGCPHGSADQVAADCRTLAAHPGPLLALPPGPMSRTWTWPPGSPVPDWLEEETGDLEITRVGDGWLTAVTDLDGADAAMDVLDLHRAALKLLGETPAPLEWLDGVQCRKCEAFALFRAPLPAGPEDPRNPPPFSECAECRDRMTRAEYGDWVKLNDAHARHSLGITCRRCQRGDHPECRWAPCKCAQSGHSLRGAA